MRFCHLIVLWTAVATGSAYGAEQELQTAEGELAPCSLELLANKQCQKVEVRLGEEVQFTIPLEHSTFFKEKTLDAHGTAKNTTEEPVRAFYKAEFLDENSEIVAVVETDMKLQPGKAMRYGSGMVKIPEDQVGKARHYKVTTWYMPLELED